MALREKDGLDSMAGRCSAVGVSFGVVRGSSQGLLSEMTLAGGRTLAGKDAGAEESDSNHF